MSSKKKSLSTEQKIRSLAKNKYLNKLRTILFPIHYSEFPKFIPMALMRIFMTFNFWIVHNLKDTLIVTTAESGAEAINFIKVWGVFPTSLLFVMVYTTLSNYVSQKRLFYGIILIFLIFYSSFTFLIYPHIDVLHMDPLAIKALKAQFSHLQWLFPVIGYWSYSLFYIFAELWSVVVITLLFWQFSNQITPVDQAKRFYMMYGTTHALGIYGAGVLTEKVSEIASHLPEHESWSYTLTTMMEYFIASCIITIILYWWVNKHVVTKTEEYHHRGERSNKMHKIQLSLMDSLKHILKSSYLGYIALMAIGYNMTLNLIEITWKSQLQLLYKTPQEFNAFMGSFNKWLAPVIVITGIIGTNVVRKFSWKVSAMITPVIMLVMGIVFFAFTLLSNSTDSLLFLGPPVALAVWVGLAQNLMARSAKFCFFDPTREMAYIPLDAELKVKGKAAVDVLSGRVGKLGGSGVQSLLLIIMAGSNQLVIAPYLSIFLCIIIVIWMIAVSKLNKKFVKLVEKKHGDAE